MSLDVYLEIPGAAVTRTGSGIFVREDGQTREISREEWCERNPGFEPCVAESFEPTDCVYQANITHNLNRMATEAGIYEHLWRPDEIGITHAEQLIQPLIEGLGRLLADPKRFREFNPSNGWGDYDGLVRFVQNYIIACADHPEALVRVWR